MQLDSSYDLQVLQNGLVICVTNMFFVAKAVRAEAIKRALLEQFSCTIVVLWKGEPYDFDV